MSANLFFRARGSWCAQVVVASAAVLMLAGAAAAQGLQWQPLDEPGFGNTIASVQVSPHDAKRVIVSGTSSGIVLSKDGGATWGPATYLTESRMADVTFHPTQSQTVFAGTASGVAKSLDGGATWKIKSAGLTMPGGSAVASIQRVVCDPKNALRVLAFSGAPGASQGTTHGYVWQSIDGGESWGIHGTVHTGISIRTAGYAAGSSSTTLYALSARALFRSTNDGVSWTQVLPTNLSPALPYALALHPTNPSVLWVSHYGSYGVTKSVDGGATWAQSSTGLDLLPAGEYRHLVVSELDPQVLYAARLEGVTAGAVSNLGVFRSGDGGASWSRVLGVANQPKTAVPVTSGVSWVEVAPSDPTKVFAVTNGSLLSSASSGSAWIDASATPSATGNGWNGKGLTGWNARGFRFHPYATGKRIMLTTTAVWVSDGADAPWVRATGISGAVDVTFSQATPNLLYATSTGGASWAVLKSTDGGLTWSTLPRPGGLSGQTITPHGIYTHPTQSNRVWAVLAGSVWYSQDSGVTWISQPIASSGYCGWIEPDPKNPLTFYVTAAAGVFKTQNGSTYALMTGSPTAPLGTDTRVAVDPSDTTRLYAVRYLSPGFWRYTSTSGWTQWQSAPTDYLADVVVDPKNPNRVVGIAREQGPGPMSPTSTGVYVVENALGTSPTVTQQNTGLALLRLQTVRFSPDGTKLVVGTDGRGFFQATTGTITPPPPPPPSGDGLPYGGTSRLVPNRVEAEHYNTGGQGVAYHDTTTSNYGGQLRTTDFVDIGASNDVGGGHFVGWTAAGEWLKYTITPAYAGTYYLKFRYAGTGTGSVRVEFGGVDKTGAVSLPSTGSFTTWKDKTVAVTLAAGQQTMKINVLSSGFNLNYVELTNPTVVSTRSLYLEAENAAVRGATWTVVNDTTASGGKYIAVPSGVNSQTAPPGSSGVVTYALNALGAGTYKVWGRVIAPSGTADSFWVRMNGGSWIEWRNLPLGTTWRWDDVHNSQAGGAVATFNLAAGNHTLDIAYREGGARLDRLFITADGLTPQ